MIAFFKLIRWTNLLAIVATMFAVHVALSCMNDFKFIRFSIIDFCLLITSTIMIAGAGNAINDYFDLRADRVNKPQKMVIGKFIQKRSAIGLHWILNLLSIIISIYLSIKYHSWFYIFIHFFSSTCLWTYSVYLKKKPFWGNFTVAFLTALVPLMVVQFYKDLNESVLPYNAFHENTWGIKLDYTLIYFFACLAFITNLAREIIKDIQDIPGDKLIGVRSLPIVFGEKKAGLFALLIASLQPILIIITYKIGILPSGLIFITILIISSVLSLSTWISMGLYSNPKISSLLLKLSLFVGILSLFSLCH